MVPHNQKDKEITAALKAHFEPKPLIMAQWFHFHHRNQSPGESVAEYLAELRRLASKCNFGAYLDQALRDRLECSLQSEAIQKCLLSEVEPTLARIVEIAQGMEAAHKQAQALKTPETVTVAKMESRPSLQAKADHRYRLKPVLARQGRSHATAEEKSGTPRRSVVSTKTYVTHTWHQKGPSG